MTSGERVAGQDGPPLTGQQIPEGHPLTEPMDAVRVALARRRGNRAAEVLEATFDDFGFRWRGNPARGEIARQVCALDETGDFAADLTSVAVGAMAHFGQVCALDEVRAAVRRHLGDKP